MKEERKERIAVLLGRLGFFAVDSSVMAAAYLSAFLLRFDFEEPWWGWHRVASSFVTVWLVQYVALMSFGCHRMLWRYVSVSDVPRFMAAVASASVALFSLRVFLPGSTAIRPPYSITLINSVLVFGGLLLVRYFCRMLQNGEVWRNGAVKRSKRILLVGAGEVGDLVVRELRRQAEQTLQVVGFLDDDPGKQQARIQGFTVLGRVSDLSDVVRRKAVDEVIVSMAPLPRETIRRVVHACEEARVPVRILPTYHNVIDGTVSVSRLREIEIADLLGREESQFDEARVIGLVNQKRILITGAGGSIGSELVRQVARMGPVRLILFERSENALYEIDREIRDTIRDVEFVSVIGDICDAAKVEAVLAEHRPQLILHAAAYKHVPLMEQNAAEAIKNNVFGTRTLAEAAMRQGVERFVLISTDKAVNPVSVMGITKRLAEQVIQSLDQQRKTRFSAVRFGNVLDSSGSVVPLFREQIRRGGPVTVTHPEMSRYFMTIAEAVSLVLQAAALAEGGEVFVLDMGAPVRIVELAEEMIALSGLRPHEDVSIVYTGIRPGEKLFEELDISERSVYKTEHAHIFISKIRSAVASEVGDVIKACEEICRMASSDGEQARNALKRVLAFERNME